MLFISFYIIRGISIFKYLIDAIHLIMCDVIPLHNLRYIFYKKIWCSLKSFSGFRWHRDKLAVTSISKYWRINDVSLNATCSDSACKSYWFIFFAIMKPWRERCEECSTSTTLNVHAINSTTLIYSCEEIARKCTNFSPNGGDAKCDLQKVRYGP